MSLLQDIHRRMDREKAEQADAIRRQELALAMLFAVKPTDRALAGWGSGATGRVMLARIASGQEAGG